MTIALPSSGIRRQGSIRPVIHLDDERPPAIGGVGVVRHRSLVGREVELPAIGTVRRELTMPMCRPVFTAENNSRSRSSQVSPAALPRSRAGSPPGTGIENVFHPLSVAAVRRSAIRREKTDPVLRPRVAGQQDRFAVGELLEVDRIGIQEGPEAAEERHHAAIRRDRGGDRRFQRLVICVNAMSLTGLAGIAMR